MLQLPAINASPTNPQKPEKNETKENGTIQPSDDNGNGDANMNYQQLLATTLLEGLNGIEPPTDITQQSINPNLDCHA